jgi:transcriptional regulator with XRE-family HTH domain
MSSDALYREHRRSPIRGNTLKLQELLTEARRAKGVSLREVERATGVSNAYLSQMETGAVAEPSPRKLQALAEYYGVSYGALMNSCGYAVSPKGGEPSISSAGAVFMGEKLTGTESAALAAFLHELRRRSPRSK